MTHSTALHDVFEPNSPKLDNIPPRWACRACLGCASFSSGLTWPTHPEATPFRFRPPRYTNDLSAALFAAVLLTIGLKVATGATVDAIIGSVPSSTKNAQGKRDPELYETRKSQQ